MFDIAPLFDITKIETFPIKVGVCVFSLQFVTREILFFFFIQYTDVLAFFCHCDKHHDKNIA